MRLDKILAQQDFISSRSRAAELIDLGLVTSLGQPLKASQKMLSGQSISVQLPAPVSSTLIPLNAPLDRLFEDDDLIVINKPAPLVVHPAAGHAQDTLVNILLHHVDHLSMGFSENRPGIVHRLDRDTSGVLVVAKNDFAHHHLAEQFRLKTVHRIYWAIVFGEPRPAQGTLTSRLARHPQDRKRIASTLSSTGKLAITHYQTVETLNSNISWLRCRLETGRTHQIRVHLSEAGYPILGDEVYGKARHRGQLTKRITPLTQLNRICLHACELGFTHPRTKEQLNFHQGWPLAVLDLLQALGFQNV